jgi:hypothetical protein
MPVPAEQFPRTHLYSLAAAVLLSISAEVLGSDYRSVHIASVSLALLSYFSWPLARSEEKTAGYRF